MINVLDVLLSLSFMSFNQDCWHSQCFHIVTVTELLAVKSLWKWSIIAAYTLALFPVEFPTSRCHRDKLADWKLTLQKCVCVCLNRISTFLHTVCLFARICAPLLSSALCVHSLKLGHEWIGLAAYYFFLSVSIKFFLLFSFLLNTGIIELRLKKKYYASLFNW